MTSISCSATRSGSDTRVFHQLAKQVPCFAFALDRGTTRLVARIGKFSEHETERASPIVVLAREFEKGAKELEHRISSIGGDSLHPREPSIGLSLNVGNRRLDIELIDSVGLVLRGRLHIGAGRT